MRILFLLSVLSIFFVFPLTLGCGGNGGVSLNKCYLSTSSDPCFESNSTNTEVRSNTTTNEVITGQKEMPSFMQEIPVTNILKDRPFSPTPEELPEDCREWIENVIVITNPNDWERFRNSCFYSFFQLPEVNFSQDMIIVSMQAMSGLGTTVEAALDFNKETGGIRLVIVITDEISPMPNPAPGFPFHIVSVPERGLPIDIIRVKEEDQPDGGSL